jgi:antitoxin VapB
MNIASLFTNGRSQAVRLPGKCRFDEEEVIVTRIGDIVILYPRRKGWNLLARGVERFTEDFMKQRDQPAKAERRRS